MDRNNLYIDFHVLQTVPPSCVNRDDTGSPKTAIYGGVTRARVSSQAWKHAMREEFERIFAGEELGVRTKKVVDMLAAEIAALRPEADANGLALKALGYIGIKIDSKKNESDVLCFFSPAQAKALAALAVAKESDKKKYKAALKGEPGYDMALFGRMVAADPSLNYDAAAQVAHSISTHGVQTEYDYFAAVDDLSPEDNAGAGHIGTIEFNSATLYRYATVNVGELAGLLGRDAAKVVRGFAEAFIVSMPTGKQNSFGNRTRPDVIYAACRKDQPVNLCGAFEEPVKSRDGYVQKSAERLMNYARETYQDYVAEPALELGVGKALHGFMDTVSRDDLLDRVEKYAEDYLVQREDG
ncbi:type I-E CRISPR-associated protein Cas7/Cse4/CasC [Lachnoclostridium sp. Marseille-P6806]|uniref:type I-E CRISPR-associated protein Cas7/Cse4/CasC n=1 Tax=Lachnoclostridium sp. Marseille-P6806 TaxID=2364793 RepID=UPI0010324381|nr:type I-E CRISPR-associated protein Cas7/Cse4/CasC [Lachnoclostridium sp. Marseille-P6806]